MEPLPKILSASDLRSADDKINIAAVLLRASHPLGMITGVFSVPPRNASRISGVQRRGQAFAASLAGLLLATCSPAHAGIYYVDYASGSDDAAGTSPNKPWRHAPGDIEASGQPKAIKLLPGDIVRFRGGVAYRGVILLPASGTQSSPITYAGDQWGDQLAIFDGSDPVTSVTPCPSATTCGGAKSWPQLSLISYTPPQTQLVKFFDAQDMLFESQYPPANDAFFSDNVFEYIELPERDAPQGEQGRIKSSKLVRALSNGGGGGGAQLSIWTYGNQVTRRPITSISGDTLEFAPNGIRLYKDRPGRAALVNAAGLVAKPGHYAVIAPGQAVAWLRNPTGAGLSVGSGRRAIDIRGQSDIVIRGFVFERFAATKYGEGVQITNSGGISSRALIEGNIFRRSSLYSGAGAIMIGKVDNARIVDNTFADQERGSGIRTNIKPVTNLQIIGNHFERLGKTGILVMGSSDVTISRNTMDGLYGIHGNGISVYLDNRRVKVSENRIINASRPMTFHGEAPDKSPGDHDLLIDSNVFMTKAEGAAALVSYGKTRGVTITNNVLIGPKLGMALSAKDSGLVVTNNSTSGIATKGDQPADWVVKDNKGVSMAQALNAARLNGH